MVALPVKIHSFSLQRTHAGGSFYPVQLNDRGRIQDLVPGLAGQCHRLDRRGRHRGCRHVNEEIVGAINHCKVLILAISNPPSPRTSSTNSPSPTRRKPSSGFSNHRDSGVDEIPVGRHPACRVFRRKRGESHRRCSGPSPPGHHDQRRARPSANKPTQAKRNPTPRDRGWRWSCCSQQSSCSNKPTNHNKPNGLDNRLPYSRKLSRWIKTG